MIVSRDIDGIVFDIVPGSHSFVCSQKRGIVFMALFKGEIRRSAFQCQRVAFKVRLFTLVRS